MKNQYFGDINDYLKYGLLRLITKHTSLRVGICWMLTPNDGQNDGSRTRYLSDPETWRHYDPDLYDFLRYCVVDCGIRNIAQIETEQVLPGCQFHSAMLIEDIEARHRYFDNFKRLAGACDLIFFDTDNGMAIKSKPYGRKGSSKYLYWQEVSEFYYLGYSLLIFQYHRRMKYDYFVKRLSAEFETNIGVRPLCFYRTMHVTLLLISQSKHRELFEEMNKAVSDLPPIVIPLFRSLPQLV